MQTVLTFIAKLAAGGPPAPGRSTKRTMVGRLVAVVLFGAPVLAWSAAAPPAGADQLGSAKAQVDALQARVSAGATRIHNLTIAYDQANLTAANLNQQLSGAQATLGSLRAKMAASQAALRRQAVLSYTGSGVAQVSPPSNGAAVNVRDEYLTVVTGDVTDSVDHYRLDQQRLQAATALVNQEQTASQQAAAAAAQARQQALSEASSEQARLGQFQAQLARLLQAVPASAPTRPSTQGLPVGNGLVAVVTKLVSPVPAAPPAPPAISSPRPTATSPATVTLPSAPPTTVMPSPPPTTVPSAPSAGAGGEWLQLRECESGDNYQANTGNGFYGAYQFSAQTWMDLGYPGRPDQEPPGMQDAAAQKLQAQSGWGQWPACSAALGLH